MSRFAHLRIFPLSRLLHEQLTNVSQVDRCRGEAALQDRHRFQPRLGSRAPGVSDVHPDAAPKQVLHDPKAVPTMLPQPFPDQSISGNTDAGEFQHLGHDQRPPEHDQM
ncbi:Hypothetical_protein [Hexamita inflata]|uniref:Hypothetical_protein n=1 Tax=Hexamita inflata TaxID=28002 RepID=A0AA86Q6S2_9EUKA|nr:Hypothetical protein HINF_LOCUS40851 [Hexamita inflata]